MISFHRFIFVATVALFALISSPVSVYGSEMNTLKASQPDCKLLELDVVGWPWSLDLKNIFAPDTKLYKMIAKSPFAGRFSFLINTQVNADDTTLTVVVNGVKNTIKGKKPSTRKLTAQLYHTISNGKPLEVEVTLSGSKCKTRTYEFNCGQPTSTTPSSSTGSSDVPPSPLPSSTGSNHVVSSSTGDDQAPPSLSSTAPAQGGSEVVTCPGSLAFSDGVTLTPAFSSAVTQYQCNNLIAGSEITATVTADAGSPVQETTMRRLLQFRTFNFFHRLSLELNGASYALNNGVSEPMKIAHGLNTFILRAGDKCPVFMIECSSVDAAEPSNPVDPITQSSSSGASGDGSDSGSVPVDGGDSTGESSSTSTGADGEVVPEPAEPANEGCSIGNIETSAKGELSPKLAPDVLDYEYRFTVNDFLSTLIVTSASDSHSATLSLNVGTDVWYPIHSGEETASFQLVDEHTAIAIRVQSPSCTKLYSIYHNRSALNETISEPLYNWSLSSYAACPNPCDSNTTVSRTVTCVTNTDLTVVDDQLCPSPKPSTDHPCTFGCIPGDSTNGTNVIVEPTDGDNTDDGTICVGESCDTNSAAGRQFSAATIIAIVGWTIISNIKQWL